MSSRRRTPQERYCSCSAPEHVAVELDAEAGAGRHGDASRPTKVSTPRPITSCGLPRVVGVAGVGQVRRRGGEVRHRGERDAEVGVAVHRQPHAPRSRRCRPSSCERRRPPQRWWSESTTWTASVRDRGRQVLERDHAHVGGERHVGARRDLRPCPSMPGVGSSRYSTTPASRVGDLERGSTASRRRWGRAAAAGRGRRRAAPRSPRTPRRAGSTPPLSLSEPKPQPSTIRCACATSWSGVSASPHASSAKPGWPAHL